MSDSTPPKLQGIHHLKFPVSDLDRSLAFYQRVFGARRIPEADHRRAHDGALYAYICEVPGLGTMLELRLHPEHARKQRRFDPVTFAVADRAALTQWAERLDREGIPHSGEIVSLQAWLLIFEDPDQRRLRLYALESHGPELKPDEQNPWLVS